MKTLSKINFHLFCGLSFFSCGTAMMDYFLVYPSRAIVGDREFVQYHSLLEAAILPVSVMPFLLITIQSNHTQVAFFRKHHGFCYWSKRVHRNRLDTLN